MIYGYARILENEQSLNELITALNKYGINELYSETATDKKTIQKNLNELLSKLISGDVFVIWELNQLDRTIIQLYLLINNFERNNISFVSLKEKINTRHDKGFVNTLNILVQMDRRVSSNRSKEGLSKRKEKGRAIGRKPVSKKKIEKAIEMYYANEVSISEIEKMTGISKTTLYKYIRLKEEKGES